MHLSQFNGYIETNGDTIIFNTKTDSSIRFKNSRIDEVKSYILNNDIEEFYTHNLKVDYDESLECKKDFKKIQNDSTNLMVNIILSYDCNAACAYCFEKINNNKILVNESVENVTNYLLDNYLANKSDCIYINYFGGEPMLEFEKLLQIHDFFANRGIRLYENITTNGTLFDQIKINELNKRGIRNLQITIDGNKNLQDKRRPLKDGTSSWEKIIKGITKLINYDFEIVIRINVDVDNYDKLHNIINDLPKSIVESNKTTFIPALVIGQNSGDFKTIMESRANIYKSIWKQTIKKDLPILIKPYKFSPCSYDSAVTGFYIDFNGNIYSCGGDVGDFSKVEGKYLYRNKNYYKRINNIIDDKCYVCRYFYKCMGGCNYEKKTLGQNCQYKFFDLMYKEYYKIHGEMNARH